MAVKPDLVGIDEIAERLGRPRSTVSVWASRGWPPGSRGAKPVPPPKVLAVLSGRISVYDWHDVEAPVTHLTLRSAGIALPAVSQSLTRPLRTVGR